jgi:hypothetical protein
MQKKNWIILPHSAFLSLILAQDCWHLGCDRNTHNKHLSKILHWDRYNTRRILSWIFILWQTYVLAPWTTIVLTWFCFFTQELIRYQISLIDSIKRSHGMVTHVIFLPLEVFSFHFWYLLMSATVRCMIANGVCSRLQTTHGTEDNIVTSGAWRSNLLNISFSMRGEKRGLRIDAVRRPYIES